MVHLTLTRAALLAAAIAASWLTVPTRLLATDATAPVIVSVVPIVVERCSVVIAYVVM